MPIDWTGISTDSEYNVKHIGAFHMIGDDAWEPQRNNNFEVRIYGLSDLTTVEGGIRIPQGTAEDTLTLSTVSVGSLGQEVSVIEIPYGNTKVKYAGLPSVNNVDIVYNDYIGKSTERIIAAWHAKVANLYTEVVGRATVYKKTGELIETAPDGTLARVWRLEGVWPSNVQYGEYSYEGNSTRQITMTLTIDRMIPLG